MCPETGTDIKMNENMLDHKRKVIILKSTTLFTAKKGKHVAVKAQREEYRPYLVVDTQGNGFNPATSSKK